MFVKCLFSLSNPVILYFAYTFKFDHETGFKNI
jgi:hypothetical protein